VHRTVRRKHAAIKHRNLPVIVHHHANARDPKGGEPAEKSTVRFRLAREITMRAKREKPKANRTMETARRNLAKFLVRESRGGGNSLAETLFSLPA